MSFNAFTSNLSQRFQELSTSVSQRAEDLSTNLPSIAQTTQRMVQERLGQVTDISQLPQEYVELEKKVDALKLSYAHLLQVTSIYENESYDYPKYVSDSLNDFSKSVSTKVQELSRATSTAEAQDILVAPGPTTEPKTLNYALSKVALTGSEMFHALPAAALTPRDSQTAAVLLAFSNVQAQVAQKRLAQDTRIQTKFNKALRDELAQGIAQAAQARKDVHSKRLRYDVARANLLNARPEKEASLRVQMEALEDEFAQATENATVVMQRVLAQSALLPDLKVLAQAQLEYFQGAAALMQQFVEGNAFGTDEEDEEHAPASATTATTEADAAVDADSIADSTTKGGITMSVDDE
ncbi:Gvp36 protein [Maudiozyma humilis]|uniref:Gvp36 protein n=1 Tax=Maudiozyma humilis TaxID=51915 RepID=A0AAV5RW10_MAUHU|nr:Gvp36 protein [Kazachstania humilis]